MSKFIKTKLEGKLRIKHGFPFLGEHFGTSGDYIILTPGNFYERGGFKFEEKKAKYYCGDFPKSYISKKGDVVIAMTEQAPGLLGCAAFIPVDNKFLHNQRIGLIEVEEEKLDKDFTYHLFNTNLVRRQLRLSSTGTKVKHTSPNRIYDVEVFIPEDVNYQKKIANFFQVIDLKIEINNKINSELEKMAKTLYDYWFVQFDFPDENGKPYKSSGGKMVWSDELKRENPEGWEVKTIKDLLEVLTGKEDANFATENGKYTFFTCGEDILKCDEYKFNGKAVLVAGNGNFNVKLYEGKFNAYQRTYVLIPEDEKYYTLIYIAVSNLINHFKNGSNGSIVKFIRKGDIEDIMLPLPKQGFDDLFNQLNTITKKIEVNLEENQKLAELRDWLLPMLMNGQVSVK